ncbi:MAG: hypothetical protein ACI4A8_02555 [Muribaculaceae bacterium]
MKKTLLIAIMAIVSALTMQAQWTVPGDSEYAKHIVVNAVLKTPSGTALGSLGDENSPVYIGAFIDGNCRAYTTQASYGTTATEGYYYQLRIGVAEDDADKDITFKLSVSDTEYTLSVPTALTASYEDKTVGTLSDLYVINYNPVIGISPESQEVDVNMGETVNMLGLVKFEALDGSYTATLPDTLPWDYSNCLDYLSIENNILTPIKAGTDRRWVGLSFNTGYIPEGNTSSVVSSSFVVSIHQPITSIALNEQSSYYKDGKIEVNVNDSITLTAALADIITILPENTTESVTWTLTNGTENGIVEKVVEETTYWNPAIVGEYEMTASYGELTPVAVPVKVIQPATEIYQSHQLITVILGDDVTQYLPYTFSIVPSNATYQLDGITYSLRESGVLTQDEDGNIKASAVGTSSVTISHRDITSAATVLSVEVVDFPTKNDYTISADPLSISLKDAELSKLDIYETLCNNVIGSTTLTKMLAQNFSFSEVNESPILTVTTSETTETTNTTTVTATKYGSTNVAWSYAVKAAKIENEAFNPTAEYTHTLGYTLNIVAGLNSITIEPMTIGLTDTDATIKLTTNPEGMQLAEDDITWTDAVTNYLEIGDRVDGKNEWKVTPKQIADSQTMNIEYSDNAVSCVGGNLTITQRLHLEEGWHWTSLYTGSLSDISSSDDEFSKIQEIRSRSQVTYNDPKYGFFGALNEMTTDEGYKVNIKEEQVLDTLVAITNWIGVDNQKSTTLSQKWNWVSNPYCFNHDLNAALGKAAGWTTDSQIISKDGGFATYNENGGWTGTLNTLVAGEAYLIYNAATESLALIFPAEQGLEAVATSSEVSTLSTRTKSPWKYDSRRFADNMSIIARATTSLEEGRYSIGAFVGDECRGEGVMINGRFFITVHGAGGEKVSFKLCDNNSGQIIDLDDEMNFAMTAGTLSEPVALSTPFISGVDGVNADTNIDIRFVGDDIVVAGVEENDVEVYNTNGVRVSPTGLAKGVYVVKVGAVTRKMIKR